MTVHKPETCTMNDDEDQQIEGVASYFKSWPGSDLKDWPGSSRAEFGKQDEEGGCWTGGNAPLLCRTSRKNDLTLFQCRHRVQMHFHLLVPSQIVMVTTLLQALLGTGCLEYCSPLPTLCRLSSNHLT